MSEISINLPDGSLLIAEIFADPEYPGISIARRTNGSLTDEVLCFAEYNSSKENGKNICICAYAKDQEEPVYYESYNDPQPESPNI